MKKDMASKMKDFSARRQAGKKAKAKVAPKRAKGGKSEPVAVKIVRDDDDVRPSSIGSYEKEREKEKKEHGGFDKYKVESACKTLEEAAEIMADPKLMAAVGAYHDKKSSKVSSIMALRKKAAAMGDEE